MSIKGGSYARFRRALQTRNPVVVEAAAAELGRINLADALAMTLLRCEHQPERYPKAAARWHARFVLENPGTEAAESALLLSALQALGGTGRPAAIEALQTLLEERGLADVAAVADDWARQLQRP